MIFIVYAALILAILGIFFLVIVINIKKNTITTLQQNIIALEKIRDNLDLQLDGMHKEKGCMQNKIEELIADNASYKAKLSSSNEYSSKLSAEYEAYKLSYKTIQEELYQAQKNLELKTQEMKEFEKRVKDWDESRQEAIVQAKAAIFETASKLSEELISKHKQETENSEKKLNSSTQQLQDQFEKIVKLVSVLDSDMKVSKETISHVQQSLLSPSGAGNLAEITLENILKASGLESGRDFIMQYSFSNKAENKRLRPDAIIFLPANNLMVIDSKASKYFTEIVGVMEQEKKDDINGKLKITMRNHLRSLSTKDYQDSLRDFLEDKKINHISSIMFLPSEAAVEKLSQIDKNFLHDAWEKDIFPVGPSGLINILTHTKFQLAVTRQNENHMLIVEEVRKLLGALNTLYGHAKKLGNSLYNASNHYDKFAASFNATLLPKAKNLENLGVHLQKNKSLPSSIERFSVISSSNIDLIEIDSVDNIEKRDDKKTTENAG